MYSPEQVTHDRLCISSIFRHRALRTPHLPLVKILKLMLVNFARSSRFPENLAHTDPRRMLDELGDAVEVWNCLHRASKELLSLCLEDFIKRYVLDLTRAVVIKHILCMFAQYLSSDYTSPKNETVIKRGVKSPSSKALQLAQACISTVSRATSAFALSSNAHQDDLPLLRWAIQDRYKAHEGAIQNEWSWTNLSSVPFVEQPVGTGFSQGTPTARVHSFFSRPLYAGMCVPYITKLHLQAISARLTSTYKGSGSATSQIPAVPFMHKYENVFAFNQIFLVQLDALSDQCNYMGYLDTFDLIFDAALTTNPVFNIYRIFDTWPILWDVLGFPGSFDDAQTLLLHFDRTDVKTVIHTPQDVD
ncbi:hypothetical protein OF83DRAFT_1172283 [Amylostereum chailletii]|nr:hypothetical protein OF83DRAFT_1172283 [Amylostereum chailletii]